jgi:hypothetical protein
MDTGDSRRQTRSRQLIVQPYLVRVIRKCEWYGRTWRPRYSVGDAERTALRGVDWPPGRTAVVPVSYHLLLGHGLAAGDSRAVPVRRCAAGWVLRLVATGQLGMGGRLLARFGLIYVDFATRRRVLKDSGAAYAVIIRTRRARSADGPVADRAS